MLAEMILGSIVVAYLAGALVTTAAIKYREGDEPFEDQMEPDFDNLGNIYNKTVPGTAYKRIWGWPIQILLLPFGLVKFIQRIVPSRLERQRRELIRRIPKDYDAERNKFK